MPVAKLMSERWTALGRNLFCPAAVSRRPGAITLFARTPTGELCYREWNGRMWGELHSLGIPVAHDRESGSMLPLDWPLTGCSSDAARVDLFARSSDGDLLQMTAHGEKWGAFERLGAPATTIGGIAVPLGLVTAPAACSGGPDRIDVFAVARTGELLHTEWDGSEWSGFESLGAPAFELDRTTRSVPLSGPVAACASGQRRLSVFAQGSRGDLMMKSWDGTGWSDFVSLGWPEIPDDIYPAINMAAPLTGTPAACSWGPDRIDVFARGLSGEVLHKAWDGRNWTPFVSLGMPVTADAGREPLASTGAITACTWGPNRLDVFTRAVDGNLYHAWWDGSWTR
jgi:hypothetical protein